MSEPIDHLAAARQGSQEHFSLLVAPLRNELRAHCYRMTGSLADADDLVQESLLRAWRAIDGFEGRSSLRTWLYRIATHACLSALERRPRRMLPLAFSPAADPTQAPAAPLLDPVWLEPAPESLWARHVQGPESRYGARESVALALVAALQELPALQRAVLLLRDVLSLSAAETAEALETTVAAVNSALQRARASLEARAERLQQGLDLAPDDERTRRLLRRYVEAWESGDATALVALLREDAVLSMPPVPSWYRGREAIGSFLRPLIAAMGTFVLRPIRVSGTWGAAAWLRALEQAEPSPHAIHVLAVERGEVTAMHTFMNPALFAAFDLPVRP